MAYFDDHPKLFRLWYGVLLVYFSILGAVNFYRYAGAPTDENWFRTTPANVYLTKSFPAQPPEGRSLPDSILAGDILVQVNGKNFDPNPPLAQIIRELPPDSPVELGILRPAKNFFATYQARKSALPDSFYRLLPPTARVTDVFKDGASDRAGMKIGDLIFRVNGQALTDYPNAADEAEKILRRGQIGKAIAYDVIRDNQRLTLQVKLAKFGIAIPLLVFCLSGLGFAGAGAFIALRRPHLKAARLVGLAFLLIGFFMTIVVVRRDAFFDAFTALRDFTLPICAVLGAASGMHSSFYFPKARPEILAKPWLSYGLYWIALLTLGAGFIWAFERALMIGVSLSALYISAVHFSHRRFKTTEYKKLGRVIQWTSLPASVISFVWLQQFSNQNPKAGYAGILLALIPLSYLYTIGRYHLLEMDLRVRRNVQYTIIALLWWVGIVKLAVVVFTLLPQVEWPLPNLHFTGGAIEILDEPMSPEQRAPLEKGLLMCVAIVLSVGFWKLGKSGQQRLDKKYHRTEYDYRRAAGELADVMSTKLNMVDIARGMVQKLYQLMYLKRVGVVLFRNQKSCCCREAYGLDERGWEELCIAIDQKLLDVLKNFRSESRLSVDYLPNGLKQTLTEHGFRHIIQIRSKEKLVGAMLIGEKRSEIPFCQEDFDFLTAAAKQASVAVENSFLYEELAEQERLKHELEIARRIQLASLPQTTPKVDGLDIAGVSIPATDVGGDYFDYLNGTPNEIRVIIGDVSGKGTSAALYMSKVQGIMRSLHGFGLSPKELFVRANHLLCQDMERKSFVTSLGADFVSSTRRMILVRAGHLPLFYYHAQTKLVEKITPKGLGLGLDNHGMFATELEERTVQYEAGDVFLFVTDGVTEAQSNGRGEFGEESVVKILAKSSSFSAMQIRDGVINAVKQFAGENTQHDDLTVVVVKAV